MSHGIPCCFVSSAYSTRLTNPTHPTVPDQMERIQTPMRGDGAEDSAGR